MSLRARVALATTLLTVVVVGLAGLALVALVARHERDQLDEELAQQSELVATRAVARGRDGTPASLEVLPEGRAGTSLGISARVLVDGEAELVIGDSPLAAASPQPAGYHTVLIDGDRYRVLTRPLDEVFPRLAGVAAADGVTVEVTSPTSATTGTIREVRQQVVRLGILAVLVAAALGWLLGGAALRPLARLRRDAERVTAADDPVARVTADQGLREVDELGRSINHMLERIAQANDETRVALEASRAFAGNAAHELRTPLTSMQANLDVLERNPDLPPGERTQVVHEVVAQQQRLLRLLGALRLLARGDLEQVPLDTPVDLADLAHAAVASARRRHPAATITLAVDEGPTEVPGWDEGLRVLVDNLLDNAALHGRDAEGAARIDVTVTAAPATVAVVVDDHGPGIPPSDRAHVLERFARGREVSAPGSGLGLALVDQQARLHGGTVSISDAPHGGARLMVQLPRRRPLPPAQPPGRK